MRDVPAPIAGSAPMHPRNAQPTEALPGASLLLPCSARVDVDRRLVAPAACFGLALVLHGAVLLALLASSRDTPNPAVLPEVVVQVVAPPPDPAPEPAEAATRPETVELPTPPPPADAPPPVPVETAPVEPAPLPTLPAEPAAAAQPRVPARLLPPNRPKPVATAHPHADTQAQAAPAAPPQPQPAPAVPARPAPVQATDAHAAEGEAALEARIRDAVQAAVRYPAAARMMGLSGRARLLLDYRAGVVGNVSLAQSAGASVLDDAAVLAARSAHYPPPPPDLGDRALRFLVWVEFRPG